MVGSGRYYRVSLGPIQTADAAQSILGEVHKKGFSDARIMVD